MSCRRSPTSMLAGTWELDGAGAGVGVQVSGGPAIGERRQYHDEPSNRGWRPFAASLTLRVRPRAAESSYSLRRKARPAPAVALDFRAAPRGKVTSTKPVQHAGKTHAAPNLSPRRRVKLPHRSPAARRSIPAHTGHDAL
jgi:hypothetical protein